VLIPLALVPYLLLIGGGAWLGHGIHAPAVGWILGIAGAAAWGYFRHQMHESRRTELAEFRQQQPRKPQPGEFRQLEPLKPLHQLVTKAERYVAHGDYRAAEPLIDAMEIAKKAGDIPSLERVAAAARELAARAPAYRSDMRDDLLKVAAAAGSPAPQIQQQSQALREDEANPAAAQPAEPNARAADAAGGGLDKDETEAVEQEWTAGGPAAHLEGDSGLESPKPAPDKSNARKILDERYARGEISRDEFIQIRHDLAA
jgi:Short C-terminal domain